MTIVPERPPPDAAAVIIGTNPPYQFNQYRTTIVNRPVNPPQRGMETNHRDGGTEDVVETATMMPVGRRCCCGTDNVGSNVDGAVVVVVVVAVSVAAAIMTTTTTPV